MSILKKENHHPIMCPVVKPVQVPFKKIANCGWIVSFFIWYHQMWISFIRRQSRKRCQPLSAFLFLKSSLSLSQWHPTSFLPRVNECFTHYVSPTLHLGRETGKHGLFFIFPFCCLQQTDTQRVTSPTRTSWENDEKQQRQITKKERKK